MRKFANETRRESYSKVLETLGERQKLVYKELKEMDKPVTANELASSLYRKGLTHSPDRNNVHPRLNEMVSSNVIEIVGKKKCSISSRTCAVYQIKQV